jgi:hypothetical protein
MPIRFNYDADSEIVFTKAEGLVSFEEIQKHLDEEADAGSLSQAEIFDASSATTNLTSDETRSVARRLQALMQTGLLGPTAIVTDNDVFFGMARMLEVFCELYGGPKVSVFRTCEEGLNWLHELRAKSERWATA